MMAPIAQNKIKILNCPLEKDSILRFSMTYNLILEVAQFLVGFVYFFSWTSKPSIFDSLLFLLLLLQALMVIFGIFMLK